MDKNVAIEFNESTIKRVKELGVPVDHIGSVVFILFSLYEGKYDILDAIDDGNKERRIVLLYRKMQRLGLIEEAEGDDDVHFVLTPKGVEIVDLIKDEFEPQYQEIVEVAEEASEKEEVSDWIKEYIAMFPAGRHFNRPYRNSSRECAEKMKWFIAMYGFDKDVILGATRQYIESFGGNYELMRNSSNFIKKLDREKGLLCDLATACEQYIDEQNSPKKKVNLDMI